MADEWKIGCDTILILIDKAKIKELEVLKILEEPNKVQDLPTGGSDPTESEGFNRWCETFKALLDIWHKTGYLQSLYLELPEVCERREVTEVTHTEPLESESFEALVQDTQPPDKREQTKVV